MANKRKNIKSRTQLQANVPRGTAAGRSRRPKRKAARGVIADLIPGIGGLIETTILGFAQSLLGAKGGAAPAAFAGRTQASQINVSRQHGVEQIATITVPEGTPAGTVLWQGLVAAPELGVRLRQNAALWARTCFLKLGVMVESANSTQINGNYTIAHDPDPTTIYDSGAELPQRLMALVHASKANAWASTAIVAGLSNALLFNRFSSTNVDDAEIRQYADGQLVLATTTDFESLAEYTINIVWDVEFEQPNTNVDLLNEDRFGLVAGGRLAVGDTDSSMTLPSDNVWTSTEVPLDDTYSVIPGACTLHVQWSVGNNTYSTYVSATSIEVAGTNTIISFTPALTTWDVMEPTILVLDQSPTVYWLPNSVYAFVGFAKVSKYLAAKHCDAHAKWFKAARDANNLKRQAKLIRREHDRRFEHALTSITDEALTQKLAGINISRKFV